MTVKLYSKPVCSWCNQAKAFLEHNRISFQDLDIANDKEVRAELIRKTGSLYVPVVEIGGRIVLGYAPDEMAHHLGL